MRGSFLEKQSDPVPTGVAPCQTNPKLQKVKKKKIKKLKKKAFLELRVFFILGTMDSWGLDHSLRLGWNCRKDI